MPNTSTMQEWVRTAFGNYIDGLEDGQPSSSAKILRIGKSIYGLIAVRSKINLIRFADTFLTADFTLLRERSSRFSLQPSCSINIKDTCNNNSYKKRADPIQI